VLLLLTLAVVVQVVVLVVVWEQAALVAVVLVVSQGLGFLVLQILAAVVAVKMVAGVVTKQVA